MPDPELTEKTRINLPALKWAGGGALIFSAGLAVQHGLHRLDVIETKVDAIIAGQWTRKEMRAYSQMLELKNKAIGLESPPVEDE